MKFSILALGDVVARPGREVLQNLLPSIKTKYQPDLVIVNGENAAGGSGIETKTANEIFAAGADIITLGDHVWRRSEVKNLLNREKHRIVRPGNYPGEHPGSGVICIEKNGIKIGVMNVLGRVLTSALLDCPFRWAEMQLESVLKDVDLIVADVHAEATSEKVAFGKYFDGRINFVYGTHTHVPTADTQILSSGTAYVTDLGMCGSRAGVIGLETDVSLQRLMKGVGVAYKPASGNEWVCGVLARFSSSEGRFAATEIMRVDCSAA